jgi:hypothetical protein
VILTKKILGSIFSKSSNKANYKFNTPDYSELGVLVNNVKKL